MRTVGPRVELGRVGLRVDWGDSNQKGPAGMGMETGCNVRHCCDTTKMWMSTRWTKPKGENSLHSCPSDTAQKESTLQVNKAMGICTKRVMPNPNRVMSPLLCIRDCVQNPGPVPFPNDLRRSFRERLHPQRKHRSCFLPELTCAS